MSGSTTAGACACGAPNAPGQLECDACFEKGCAALLVARPAPAPAPEVTCGKCGRSVRRVSEPAGLCTTCEQDAARAEREAEERARREAQRRALEDSPHRCPGGCGVRMIRAGAMCGDCAAKAQRERDRAWASDVTAQGMPARYRDNAFAGAELARRVKDPKAIALVRAACVPETDRIVLVGAPGVGKTSLAAAAMRELSGQRTHVGVYVDARSLAFARSHSRLGAEAELVRQVVDAEILLLDDLGLDPDVHHSAIPDVVYQRHAACRTTIVTTSLTDAESAARFGAGVARRLFEAVDGALVLELKAPGRRSTR
jgi:DNA replication protein DnaC